MSPARNRWLATLARLALLVVSLGFTAMVAELGFRLTGHGAIYDVYTNPSYLWQKDALLGWSHEPNARGTFIGPRPFPIEYETPIEINSIGLRGPEIAPKRQSEYRVLLLGDSVTVGFEVLYEQTFGELMQKKLERLFQVPVTVINAAVRGYGTDQLYLYYRERGHALNADLVMLIQSGNDPNDNMSLHRVRKPLGKPALALQPDGTLVRVDGPTTDYPLCSAWMLDENFEAKRMDGPLNRLTCELQTYLSHHSALFSVVASLLARMPSVVFFLKDLTYPQKQLDILSNHPEPLFLPWLIEPAYAAPTRTLAEAERALSTAIIIHLAREVEAHGQRFALIAGMGNRSMLDMGTIQAAGVASPVYRAASAPNDILRFRNDGHMNSAGHHRFAEALVPIVIAQAMAERPELARAASGKRPLPRSLRKTLRQN